MTILHYGTHYELTDNKERHGSVGTRRNTNVQYIQRLETGKIRNQLGQWIAME